MNFVRSFFWVIALRVLYLAPTFGIGYDLQDGVERNSESIKYIQKEVIALREEFRVARGVMNQTCAADEVVNDKAPKDDTESKIDVQMKYVMRGVKDAKLSAHESLKQIREAQKAVISRTSDLENNFKDLKDHVLSFQSTTQNQNDEMKTKLSYLNDKIDNKTRAIGQELNKLKSSVISLSSSLESFEQNSKTLSSKTNLLEGDVKDLRVKVSSTEDTFNRFQDELKTKMKIILEWKYFQGSLYLFVASDRRYSFDAARLFCKKRNSDLAAITNQKENAFVTSHLSGINTWLGGNDRRNEGQWEWTSEERFSYSNWNDGEPSDSYLGEDCLSIYDRGVWNDFGCHREFKNFVCEKSVW